MPGLHFDATLNNSAFLRNARQIQDSVKQTSDEVKKSGLELEQYFNRIKSAAAMALAGFSAKEFVQRMTQVRAEFQQLEVSFTTMLGSAEKAEALMRQLTKTAATTPFDLQGVASGAKQLLAYGIAADKVNDTLIHLGDIAAGLSIPLGDLVYLYGTTMTQGRMYTQDLRQFMNRGIPLAEELAKQFGVAKDKVGELVTAGKIGAKEFEQALMGLSSEGGKFAGLMEAQSKTINGQISNIEDSIDSMFNELGKKSEGFISTTLSGFSFLVENYETVGKVILTVAASYGAYKGALLAVVAAQKLAAVWGNVQAFFSLAKSVTSAKDAMLLFNMACKASPIGLILGAVTAAAVAFGLFSTSSGGATTAVEKYGKSAADTMQKVDTLTKELKGLTEGSTLHKQVLDELNEILNQYGVAQVQEGDNIDIVNGKREKAIELIRQEAIERQRLNGLEEGGNTYSEAVNTARQQLLEDMKGAGTWDSLGIDTWANDELRENAAAITTIIAQVVEDNIDLIAQKEGEEYEKGLNRLYEIIQERMRRIGISEETINKEWVENAMFSGHDNIVQKYIDSLKDAKEEYIRFSSAINTIADGDVQAIERPADKAREAADFSQTSTENLITKIGELKRACDEVDRSIDIRVRFGASISFNSDDVLDFTDLHNAEAELRRRMNAANSDEAVNTLLKELREGKSKAVYGSTERSLYDEYIRELEKRMSDNSGKTARKRDNTAEMEAQQRQRQFELEQRQREEQAKQERETRAAQAKARIAQIRDDGERQRAEEDEQHRLNMEAIEQREEEMKKKVLIDMKAEWELKNKGKNVVWADTELAKKGIAAVKTSNDLLKEQKEILSSTNTEAAKLSGGAKVIDEKAVSDGSRSLDAVIGKLEDIDRLTKEGKKVVITEEADIVVPEEKSVTINTTVGSVELPYIPENATIEVTTDIDSGQYDELVERFGEEAVKRVRIETDGEIPHGADETMTVTVYTDASRLDDVKEYVSHDAAMTVRVNDAAVYDAVKAIDGVSIDEKILTVTADTDEALQALKTLRDNIPQDANYTINTKLGNIETPDIPQDASVHVTTTVDSSQYDALVATFGVQAVKSVAVAVEGDAIPSVGDETMTVTIHAEASQLDALKASLPEDTEVTVTASADASQVDALRNAIDSAVISVRELSDLGLSDEFIARLRDGSVSAQEMADVLALLRSKQVELNKAQKDYDDGPKLSREAESQLEAERAVREAERARQLDERARKEREALYDYIKEYGSIQDQKAAITKKYDEEIARTSDVIQRASLEQQKQRLLSELNMREMQGSLDWETVFNNMERQSTSSLQSLKESLRKALDAKDITAENAKTIAEKIREIEDTIARRKDPWAAWLPGLRERKRLAEDVLEIEQQIAGLQNVRNMAVGKQDTAISTLASALGVNESGLRQQWQGLGNGTADLDELYAFYDIADASQEVKDAFNELETSTTNLRNAQEKVNKAQDNRKTRQEALNKFIEGGSVAQYFKDITSGLDFAGWASLINGNVQSLSSLVDNIGLDNTEFGEAVHNFADGVGGFNNAIQSLASGDVFGAINGIVDGFQGFGRMLGIGGGNAAETNKAIDRLNDRNAILTESIDRLNDTMSKQGGSKAIETYERLARQQQELESNMEKQLQLQMGYHDAHHSFNSYWNEEGRLQQSRGMIDTMNSIFGTDLKYDLSNLDADSAAAILQSPDLAYLIEHTGKGDYGERVIEWIRQLAEQAGKTKEQTDALYASLTAGTTRDSVYSDFLSDLYDFANGVDDVTENIAKRWQQMVNEMVINNTVGENFRKFLQGYEEGDRQIEGWYDRLAKLNEEYTKAKNGEAGHYMSDAEYLRQLEALKAERDAAMKEATEDIERLTEEGIIKPIEDAASSTLITLDTIKDGWMNMLMDMSADVDDWSQDIAKLMTQALIENNIFNDEWEKVQKDWLDRYEAAISEDDSQRKAMLLKQLQDEQEGWIEENRRKAKEIYDMTGYDPNRSEQSATVEAMQRITVDQADELIGRMNAGQMIWEQHKELSRQINDNLASMKAVIGSSLGSDVSTLVSLAQTRNQHLNTLVEVCRSFRSDVAMQMDDLRRDIKNMF